MEKSNATVARRLQRAVVESLQHLRTALAAHPVEMLIALHAYAATVVGIYSDSPDDLPAFFAPCITAPIFIVTAYCLNTLLHDRMLRTIYSLWWIPYIATALIPDLAEWADHTSYGVTVVALLPLLLLSFRMRRDNTQYVAEAAHMALAAAVALLFASVALLMFYLIYVSVTGIFDIMPDSTSFISSVAAFAYILLAPMIFFALQERRDQVQSLSATGTTLLNAIVTPALIIYTAILYLYAAKILVTWTLPKGMVAGMVFAFSIAAVAVKALQQYVTRRRYDWFFDRFSLIALPLLVLFWIGTARRIGEYGVTESRFYLVLCGAVMTLCLALFLSRRTGRYLTVSITAFVLFAATAYIPPVSAERVALRSQMRRADAAAQELGIAHADGRLTLGTPTNADTVARKLHRRLYQSLDYIGRHDAQLLQERYGLESSDEYLQTLSAQTSIYASSYSEPDDEDYPVGRLGYALYLDACRNRIDLDITSYSKLSLGEVTSVTADSLGRRFIEYDDIRIPAGTLLDTQLAKIGRTRSDLPSQEEMDRRAAEMLVLTTDTMTVVFEYMGIELDHRGNATLETAEVDMIIHK